MDETLIHSSFKQFERKSDITLSVEFDYTLHTVYVLKRPYVEHFLNHVSKLFEVVIFTASLPQYANPLINNLDKTGDFISSRLFRHHCNFKSGVFIKELKKLGRDMKDVILLDVRFYKIRTIQTHILMIQLMVYLSKPGLTILKIKSY